MMSGSPSIAVVMATYNGSHYIREQLTSILNQTYKQFKVYISDDNSDDDTINIVTEFKKKDSRIVFVGRNSQSGVVNNFNNALCSTTESIVFLCDQDDIWPEDRIEKMVSYYLEHKKIAVPTLIYTDMSMVDSKGEQISPSFYQTTLLDPEYNQELKYLTWRCTAYGCTMLLDRDLLDIALPLPSSQEITMHDNWLMLCAVSRGNTYYMDYCSVQYRQHSNNHTGGKRNNFLEKLFSFKKQIKTINDTQVKRFKQLEVLSCRNICSDELLQYMSYNNVYHFIKSNILPYKKEKNAYKFFYSMLLVVTSRYQSSKEKLTLIK
ncbi:TPA: glycosyltransferase family 2 protein [Pluralibacter gergoviae]